MRREVAEEAVLQAIRVASAVTSNSTNTKAAPWLSLLPMSVNGAPATTVSPLTATEMPKKLPCAPSEAASLADSFKWPGPAPSRFHEHVGPRRWARQ